MDGIIQLIYQNTFHIALSAMDPQDWGGLGFMPGVPLESINHARPAMLTWAVNEITIQVRKEGDVMGGKDGGLHLRARKASPHAKRDHGPSVTWDAINSFSFASLQALSEKNAPIT
ncbi:hypothetical protein BU15DRAFT_66869 [Melanogaster broomeanus]|nr:hypothetical protein BU15DRAFT_66869 [Melanogaster broomeanus]